MNSWPLFGGRTAPAKDFRPLVPDHQIFRQDDQPFRYKGVSCFPIGAMWRDGKRGEIDALIQAFEGFNIFRAFEYVDWPGTGWSSSPTDVWLELLEHLRVNGWGLELTLLTSDEPERLPHAIELAEQLGAAGVMNCLLEIANEPRAHKHTDVEALRHACEASGLVFASGLNTVDEPHFGSYITHHSPRGDQWQRKGGHDLMEFYTGDGPEAPHEPWRCPAVADEPERPDEDGYHEQNYRAYFGSCALLGAGATLHYESGKYGRLPTPDEARCVKAALEGLDAFPADTPTASPGYRRIDEQGASLRTYCCGAGMVRIPPLTTTTAPEPGWTSLDPDGILWIR